jgi:hypothetical protein
MALDGYFVTKNVGPGYFIYEMAIFLKDGLFYKMAFFV